MGRTISVGRAGTDVVLDDPRVSRRHLTLEPLSDGFVRVVDLGSSNGTFVLLEQGQGRDWQPIDEHLVRLDDLLALGQYQTSARELLAQCAALPESASNARSRPISRYLRTSSGSFKEK